MTNIVLNKGMVEIREKVLQKEWCRSFQKQQGSRSRDVSKKAEWSSCISFGVSSRNPGLITMCAALLFCMAFSSTVLKNITNPLETVRSFADHPPRTRQSSLRSVTCKSSFQLTAQDMGTGIQSHYLNNNSYCKSTTLFFQTVSMKNIYIKHINYTAWQISTHLETLLRLFHISIIHRRY